MSSTSTSTSTTTTLGPRRALLVPVVLAGISMLGPFSIDTPFPAFAHLQAEFGVGADTTQQLVSAYMLAFAVMSVFHGPISDAIGRKPVMLGGLAAYGLASVAAAFAPSMELLIACRVVQGLVAGGGVIVSRTVIRDLYDGPQAQRLMSRVMMIFGLAPAIAPVVGGWLVQVGSWHTIFWFLALFAVLMFAVVVAVLPETHPAERRTTLAVRPLLRSLVTVFRSPAFQRVSWTGSFTFGGYFLYIGSAAIVVVDLLHRGSGDFWMLFVPLISGIIAGSWLSGRLAGRVAGRTLVTWGVVAGVLAGVVNLALALVPETARLPYAVIGPTLLGLGSAVGFPTLQLTLLDMFPATRGAATSVATVLTLALNATGAAVASVFTTSLRALAAVALVYVVIGAGFWTWHLRVDPDGPPPPSDPETLEPTDTM